MLNDEERRMLAWLERGPIHTGGFSLCPIDGSRVRGIRQLLVARGLIARIGVDGVEAWEITAAGRSALDRWRAHRLQTDGGGR